MEDLSNNKTARENENKAKFCKACEVVKALINDAHWKTDKKDSSALVDYFTDFDIEDDEHILLIYRDKTIFYLWYGGKGDFNNNINGIKVALKKLVPLFGAYILNSNEPLGRISTDFKIYDQNGTTKETVNLD